MIAKLPRYDSFKIMNWKQQKTQIALFYKERIIDEKNLITILPKIDHSLSLYGVDLDAKEVNYNFLSAPIPEEFNLNIVKYSGSNGLEVTVGQKRVDFFATEFGVTNSPSCDLEGVVFAVKSALNLNEIGRVGMVIDMEANITNEEREVLLKKYFREEAFLGGTDLEYSINKRGKLSNVSLNRMLRLKVGQTLVEVKLDINSQKDQGPIIFDDKKIKDLIVLTNETQLELMKSDLDIPFS